ncbi:MAG: hypothetical protein LWW76_02580 [Burkholderiales bacterium]|nr:hypothetical protein [Burkholderiales bacterium]
MNEPIKLVFKPQARALKNEAQAVAGRITLQAQSPVTLGFVNDGFERYVDVVRALRGAGAGDNFDADPLAIYLISRG